MYVLEMTQKVQEKIQQGSAKTSLHRKRLMNSTKQATKKS